MATQLATASPLVHRYSLQEFFALDQPPGGGHYELIAGGLCRVPPPEGRHSLTVANLNCIFASFASAHQNECVLFFPRAAIWPAADTYVEPDLFLVRKEAVERM